MPNAAKPFRPHHVTTQGPAQPQHRDRGGTTTERGYGADWQKLRDWYIRQQPMCEQCRQRAAEDVDHRVPFRGRHDPLRLDVSNLQALCKGCHNRKTHRQGR